MATKRTQRSKDELEQQEGEQLPKREVMSLLSTSPSVIPIPEDPTLTVSPEGTDEPVPPPGYDV